MIKPVKCAACGKDAEVKELSIWFVFCRSCVEYETGCTCIGAILRWNWKQWRARRKIKGEGI